MQVNRHIMAGIALANPLGSAPGTILDIRILMMRMITENFSSRDSGEQSNPCG